MKITIIHGQSHKGSTYHIARQLAKELDGEITEFFMPKDFSDFCVGCCNCFLNDEKLCPHYEKLKPITKAIDEADLLIFASPVYVCHATGAMKNLLDHYGYRWMVHRPYDKMFLKQAVVISTAAGGGMKSTNKDIKDSLFFWGISKVYSMGFAVRAVSYNTINEKIKNKIYKKTIKTANQIKKHSGKIRPGIKVKIFFNFIRYIQKKGWNKADADYWQSKGWDKNIRPWDK